MSSVINLREQIPLYINGTLSNDERHSFETALKQDQDLKTEYLEFHEIELAFDRFEDVSDQHLDQIFKTIANKTQGINNTAERTSPPIKPGTAKEPVVNGPTASKSAVKEPAVNEPPTTTTPEQQKEPSPIEIQAPKSINTQIEIEPENNSPEISIHQESVTSGFLSSARFAWIIAGAQFVLLIIVVFFSSSMTQNPNSGNGANQISGVTTYNVVFADNATQKDIRELLVSLDAQIANGPTSIGLYTVFVKGSKEEATKTFNKLKNSSLILLAEPSFI